jgi:hypothetical protein
MVSKSLRKKIAKKSERTLSRKERKEYNKDKQYALSRRRVYKLFSSKIKMPRALRDTKDEVVQEAKMRRDKILAKVIGRKNKLPKEVRKMISDYL